MENKDDIFNEEFYEEFSAFADKIVNALAAQGMIEAKITQKSTDLLEHLRKIINTYAFSAESPNRNKQIILLFLEALEKDLKRLESKLKEEN